MPKDRKRDKKVKTLKAKKVDTKKAAQVTGGGRRRPL